MRGLLKKERVLGLVFFWTKSPLAGLTFEPKRSGAFSEKKTISTNINHNIEHFTERKNGKLKKSIFCSDFLAFIGLPTFKG